MSANPILAVMIHVPDWSEATDWYLCAFPEAERVFVAANSFGLLNFHGVFIEIVPGDDKLKAGIAGSIVYWRVQNFETALEHVLAIGGRLYRGPISIEDGQKMCQIIDPWGNCIGLRGSGAVGSDAPDPK